MAFSGSLSNDAPFYALQLALVLISANMATGGKMDMARIYLLWHNNEYFLQAELCRFCGSNCSLFVNVNSS